MAKPASRKPPKSLLKPYLAATLLRGTGATGATLLADLTKQAFKEIPDPDRTLVEAFLPVVLGGVEMQAFVYVHRRLASWTTAQFYDETHELVVIAVKADHIGLCCSEPSMRDRLSRKLTGCATLPRSLLEQAFVGTQAKAMWLSGVHTPTASKANAKAMTGPALELALDPLGDQSFYYSAVKSSGAYHPDILVGTAPSASRIWVNRPADWDTFGHDLEAVLDHCAKMRGTTSAAQQWLQVLAQTAGDISTAANPYALALIAPELLSEAEIDNDVRENAIVWAYDGKFEITGHNGPAPSCRVSLRGEEIGTMDLTFRMVAEKAVATVVWSNPVAGFEDDRAICADLVARSDCLRIYYANGSTLAEGRLFNPAYRDQRFTWRFEDFTGYAVTDEKPKLWGGKALSDVIASNKQDGSSDDSLFAYIAEKMFPTGWLASDDGSMEFADFVHIDPITHKVTLIHAKGSNRADPDRGVSVSNYEVVVSQAVKNIRHLDRSKLATVLEGGVNKKIARAVWLDGVRQPNRAKLIKFAKTLRPNHEKSVIVLQPQLTKKENEECVGAAATATRDRVVRMRQLDTLMLAARLSCGAVGAEFVSIGAL